MHTTGFPACCGAEIIYGLDDGINIENDYSDNLIGIAITASYQKEAIKQLKELGWKPVRKFRHRRLTVWISPNRKKS